MIQDVHKFIPREPRVDGDKHGAMLTNSNTLNNIGTGPNVFRVGALMDPGEANVLQPSPYSSGSRPNDRRYSSCSR